MARPRQACIELTLEFITPAFLGGAEPRRVDRHMPLRPSAVRGALRSWFRTAAAAVMPVVHGDIHAQRRMLDSLYQAESRIFGDTSQRSAVSILPPVGLHDRHIKRFGSELPDARQRPGLRYLGYGAFGSKEGVHFVEPSARFDLRLRMPQPFDGLVELLSATVWLWLHLGGLGARVRRGFGSLRLHRAEGLACAHELQRTASSPDGLDAHLRKGVAWAMDVFRAHLPKLVPASVLGPSGDTHPNLRTLADLGKFAVLPPRDTAEDALELAGRLFRDFRSTLRRRDLGLPPLPDYFAVKDAVARRQTPRMAARAAFGLPLRYYFRSLHGQSTWILPRKRGERLERLASPLHFRVHPLDDGKTYAAVLFHMADNKAPMVGLELGQKVGSGRIPDPSVEIIDQFIEWALAQAGRLPTGTKA